MVWLVDIDAPFLRQRLSNHRDFASKGHNGATVMGPEETQLSYCSEEVDPFDWCFADAGVCGVREEQWQYFPGYRSVVEVV